ncbi:hypothetical protein C8R44DRAFT_742676 [Mycena epipterygia]|nr:hypothetical protein C8R44DRAFT_742676 [Mycena epipterygia]
MANKLFWSGYNVRTKAGDSAPGNLRRARFYLKGNGESDARMDSTLCDGSAVKSFNNNEQRCCNEKVDRRRSAEGRGEATRSRSAHKTSSERRLKLDESTVWIPSAPEAEQSRRAVLLRMTAVERWVTFVPVEESDERIARSQNIHHIGRSMICARHVEVA